MVEVDDSALQELQAEWEELSKSLPSTHDLIPCSSPLNDEYPQNVDHEHRVVEILKEAQASAQDELRKGKEALAWAQRLSEQMSLVNHCCRDLASQEDEVIRLLDRIRAHNEPTESIVEQIDHVLAADLEDWHSRDTQTRQRKDLSHQSTIAGMKYRATLKSPPAILAASAILQGDTALDRLDDLQESTTSKTAELMKARGQFLRDRQVDRHATNLHNASFPIRSALAPINAKLLECIKVASWTGHHQNESSSIQDIDVRLLELRDRISVDLDAPLRDLETLVEDEARYAETMSVSSENVSMAQNSYQTASRHRGLLDRIMAQTNAVDMIHDEASELLAKIEDSYSTAGDPTELQKEVAMWLDGISKRVPFLSPTSPEVGTSNDSAPESSVPSLLDDQTSEPKSAISSEDLQDNLVSTDRAIRDALNGLTARISASLEQVSGRTEELPEDNLDRQSLGDPPSSVSMSNQASTSPTARSLAVLPRIDLDPMGSHSIESPGKAPNAEHTMLPVDERPSVEPQSRSLRKEKAINAHASQEPSVAMPLSSMASPRPRYLSQSGPSRQLSLASGTPKPRNPSLSLPVAKPGQDYSTDGSLPRSHQSRPSVARTSPPAQHSSSLSPPATTRHARQGQSVSLGRAAGNLYFSRRAPSIPHGLSQHAAPTSEREDRILARSTSMRSLNLDRSATSSITSTRRILSASTTCKSSQPRISSSRSTISTPKRSARKYVPDPANKLDVAVGDIVNGFKVSFYL
jgi:hypothetical protein